MGFGEFHPCAILLSILNACKIFKSRHADSGRRDWEMTMILSAPVLLFGPGNPLGGSTVENSFAQIACDLRGTG